MGDKLLSPICFFAIPIMPIDTVGIVWYNDSIKFIDERRSNYGIIDDLANDFESIKH